MGMRLHVIRHFCEISSQADGMRFRRLIIIPACRTSKSRPRRLARCLPRPPQLRDRCRHLRTCHGANSSKAVPRALGTRGLAPPSTPRPRGMYRRRPRRRCRLPYLVNSSSRSASFKSLHNLGLGGKVANRSVGRYFGGCGGVGRRARDVSVSCGRPFAKSRSSPARSAWRNKPSFLVALSLTVSFIFHVMFFSALVLSLLSFFTPPLPVM